MELNNFIDSILPTQEENKSVNLTKDKMIREIQAHQNGAIFTIAENKTIGSSEKGTMIKGAKDLDIDLVVNLGSGVSIREATNKVQKILSNLVYVQLEEIISEHQIVHFTFDNIAVDLRLVDHLNQKAEDTIQFMRDNPMLQRFIMLLKFIRDTYYDHETPRSYILEYTAKICYLGIKEHFKKENMIFDLKDLLKHFPKCGNSAIQDSFMNIIKFFSEELSKNNYEWATLDRNTIAYYKNKLISNNNTSNILTSSQGINPQKKSHDNPGSRFA